MPHTRKPLHTPSDAICVPCKQAEASAADLRAVVPPDAGELLVLAWHHAPVVSQSGAKPKGSHHRARDSWLAGADGLLGDAFDTLTALVFDTLASMIRASALVEMVHALLRPSRKSCHGQIPQEALNLLMVYPKHRRDQSGNRPCKAPIALLTGKP